LPIEATLDLNEMAENPNFQAAKRLQLSLLSRLESNVLVSMAGRLPQWVNSDHLTLLGFGAMLCAGLSYWYARWNSNGLLLASFFIVVNWFGDSLDGTLARVRNRQRPRYGFYVDHIVDAFSTLFLLSGLGLSGYMNPLVAAGLVISFSLLSIETYLATYTLGIFQLSFWGFGPTELRLLLVIGNLFVYVRESPLVRIFGQQYQLFDAGGMIGIVGMMLILSVSAIRNTIALYHADTLP
jgi:archaetidylinositol phosphate synthase